MKKLFLATIVLILSSTVYSQTRIENQKLISDDIEVEDWFGNSISISDSLLLIGAPFEDDLSSGTSTLSDIGAVYLFNLNENGTWVQKQKIRPKSLDNDDHFGGLISFSKPFALISGRSNFDNNAYILKMDNGNFFGENCIVNSFNFSEDVSDVCISENYAAIATRGTVHIYEYDNSVWIKKQEIVIEGFQSGSTLSLAINDKKLVIGSPSTSEGGSNTYLYGGVVFVYEKNISGLWETKHLLTAKDRDTYDGFGSDVKLIKNKLFISAIDDEDGLSDDNDVDCAGSVYLFQYDSNNNQWEEKQKIVSTDRESYDRFGIQIDALENNLIVGTQGKKAILFKSENNEYVQSEMFTFSNSNDHYGFGERVGISKENIIIGSPWDDLYGKNSGLVFLYKTCNNTTNESTVEICKGEEYIFGSQILTESGEYTEIFQSELGCDSIVNLNLIVNSVDTSVSQDGYSLTANTDADNYQWGTCNENFVLIEEETNQKFIASANGSYAVIITQDQCIDTSECYTVIVSSINSIEIKDSFAIYPNPAKDFITIETKDDYKNIQLYVYNSIGQIVLIDQFKREDNLSINISQLPKGLYTIKILFDSKIITSKFIKN
ncbi:T9SS type A sorting domain-containing protein [Labilibaculum euxinus]|uniref:T9SS type A sorting domain-containing protein n=1 Tax=Labilibaculum euxinus TaxID=2686357 RepID=A0A7M4D947_9BACT|nr:T9SS type A sorting domain-containing protein [Labilibaculum euxinus]MUP39176.1 T9SS type A sorting domain-containing protein [Labilibaculum euxinus]MVB08381.1 T9SS type A sorting domain-containing protein [Labilibaculum euxinus]